ncbi:hypothetical protein PMAYCL1PPCAC_14950, partial [Pristionchus mayeri]
ATPAPILRSVCPEVISDLCVRATARVVCTWKNVITIAWKSSLRSSGGRDRTEDEDIDELVVLLKLHLHHSSIL